MKILIYGINFAPEPTGIGKYTGEMAAWLAASGNEVRVIAAPPYYPGWAIGPGYTARGGVKERWDGVTVWRTPLWVPSKPTGLRRVLHLISFAVASLPRLVMQLFWRPDTIVVIAPALACAPAAWLAARLCGAKAWLHVQDFEVDAAFRLGLLKGYLSHAALQALERWMFRRFDRVSTISGRMLELLRSKGVAEERIVSFPNWVDVTAILPCGEDHYRQQLDIPRDAVVALYSGSMAGKQGLELLPAAARLLQERVPKLVFVFCGEGVSKPAIERDCATLSNVRILPLQPAARLGELLRMADVHLLPQSADAADLVMPSKLTGMLSSGRPVLATAYPGTELARVVSGAGLVVAPNNLEAFSTSLETLAESPAMRARLGAAGRRYAEERLARDQVLVDFEQNLRSCLEENAPAQRGSAATPPATPPAAEETAKSV